MPDLHVKRWATRYRLPAAARDDRARLDRVLSSVVDGPLLEAALQRAGIPSTDDVCIRSVESFVRLDGSHPDARLGAEWTVALADAIATRVREGGSDVVRFHSRHEALVDMARRAAHGDLARAWAWRQVGVWSVGDVLPLDRARVEVVDALSRHPCAAPAVLAVVASVGLLAPLLADVPAAHWAGLARAVMRAWGADDDALQNEEMSGSSDDARVAENARASTGDRPALHALVTRVAARSTILRAVTIAAVSASFHRSLAILALAECEPHRVAQPDAAVLVDALAARLAAADGAPARNDVATRQARDRAHSTRDQRETPATAFADAPDEPIAASDLRARGTTAYGGLLFLLHVVRALDLPGVIAADEALVARPLRWALHQIALDLAGPVAALELDDPAALAFAGLPPGSRPPSLDALPASDAERLALRTCCDAIRAALRTIDALRSADDDAGLLQRVLSRRATVVADPAWIELRFALADATTDVRRAGLDLDPGWLPWLGAVVRFVYE